MDSDTRREIIEATGRALCAHGYADLTMQRIAERSSLTTAAIHYHFDTKDDLLDAFLDDLLDRFEARLACEASDPRERLTTFLDAVFTPPSSDDDETDDFPVALMELQAQAPYHDRFRERFRALDDAMRGVVGEAVADGVEAGHFEDADPADAGGADPANAGNADSPDPETVARVVVTAINGAHVRTVALGEGPSPTRRVVADSLRRRLGWTPEDDREGAVPEDTCEDAVPDDETRDASEHTDRDRRQEPDPEVSP